MSSFKQAVIDLGAYVKAGYSTLPVYDDPTLEIDPEATANLSGWVELAHDFGPQGPVDGRFGAQTYYVSTGTLTCTVLTPRDKGDGPTWSAADALASLLREKTIGDCTVRTVRVVEAPFSSDDTHHQIDVIVTFLLEAFV